MRYTRKQKAEIARHQGQRYVYRDVFGTLIKVVYVCKMCHREFTNLDDLEVDHIIPVSVGGPETLDNLQLLCTKDNRKKGNAIRIKGKLIRLSPRAVQKKSSTSKKKSSITRKKNGRISRNSGTIKKKTTTVKRKTSTTKRKSSTVKKKRSMTKRKASTVKRKRR
jgi:5-methylcytosine-specific restriction endonuclease McrA